MCNMLLDTTRDETCLPYLVMMRALLLPLNLPVSLVPGLLSLSHILSAPLSALKQCRLKNIWSAVQQVRKKFLASLSLLLSPPALFSHTKDNLKGNLKHNHFLLLLLLVEESWFLPSSLSLFSLCLYFSSKDRLNKTLQWKTMMIIMMKPPQKEKHFSQLLTLIIFPKIFLILFSTCDATQAEKNKIILMTSSEKSGLCISYSWQGI